MNVLCRMKAAGALASAVPRSIGPRRYNQGRFRKRSGAWVHAGTSAPCVVHACSTVAAITASQTVPVSGGLAAASALRASLSIVDAVVVAGEALDDEPPEGGGVPARPRLGRQLAQLGCGDSLASARAGVPRLLACMSAPGLGLSVAHTHFADGAPPVSAAVGGHRGCRRRPGRPAIAFGGASGNTRCGLPMYAYIYRSSRSASQVHQAPFSS